MFKKNFVAVFRKGSGQRIDRVLQAETGLSRKKVKQLLDQGRILINDRKVVIASWEVKGGDRLEVRPEGEEVQVPADEHYLKVVSEDRDLLVVEKDAGVSCEKSLLATRPTMVAIINAYLKRKYPHLKHHYLGLVHRLDQETSGLMVYSKTKEGNRITDQFKGHSIKRHYLAIVEGRIDQEEGRIERSLEKNNFLPSGRKVALSAPGSGRPAVTSYQVRERYHNATLVEVRPDTGRTHQIRVHLASIGHPIVGDKIYGNIPSQSHFPRQALHASYLRLHHPVTAARMEFKSELPRDMRRLVDRLRIRS